MVFSVLHFVRRVLCALYSVSESVCFVLGVVFCMFCLSCLLCVPCALCHVLCVLAGVLFGNLLCVVSSALNAACSSLSVIYLAL